jgi:uncharacterized membrane protein
MGKSRLEAFSDGVFAILLTIMVLELKIPRSASLSALRPVLPVFLTYVLSFVTLGIYWVNHHHMLHTVAKINGRILWANLHLLFWLSLFPFATGWMGENHVESVPAAFLAGVFLLAGVAYEVLQLAIIADQGKGSRLAAMIGGDVKGKISLALYAMAVPVAFVSPWITVAVCAAVALIWLIPDPRIEKRLRE